MSFQPIINITTVPRNSTSFSFTDITGNSPTNTTGFGAVNAPATRADITSIWGEVQPYGAEPIHASSVAGTLTGTVTVTVTITDGVQWLRVYYGQLKSLTYTVSDDRKTLTTSDPTLSAKMDSVIAVEILSGDFPVRVKDVTATTIVLEEELSGTVSSYTQIFTYWEAQVRVLVLNCGESMIGNAIARMPNRRADCNNGMEILDKILLKLGAQYAFNCGNYSEADESAKLMCGSASSLPSNCINCG